MNYKVFVSILVLGGVFFYKLSADSVATPVLDTSMLLASEKNTIKVYQDSASSVVNVSNIQLGRRSFWDLEPVKIPRGTGSGFIWSKEGYIVTNFHVVQGGDSFLVSFHQDKKQYSAEIVGVEPAKDIAVLKLRELPSKLIPIGIGSSEKLLVGQKVIAIGNPFGLDHTMTTGIVSALGRKIDGIGGVKIADMIQTDASINPGNSGGPLLDSSGKLIGINTVIFSSSGTSAGVGFAVPVDTVKRVVPQLIKYGKVIRPGLGINPLPEHARQRFGINQGVVIMQLDPRGGAASAGLKGMRQDRHGRYYLGDIILQINGVKVNNVNDIYQVLDKLKVGDTVNTLLVRGEKEKNVRVTLKQLN